MTGGSADGLMPAACLPSLRWAARAQTCSTCSAGIRCVSAQLPAGRAPADLWGHNLRSHCTRNPNSRWPRASPGPGTLPVSPGSGLKACVGQGPLLTGCSYVAALFWWLGDFRPGWLAPALFNLLAVMKPLSARAPPLELFPSVLPSCPLPCANQFNALLVFTPTAPFSVVLGLFCQRVGLAVPSDPSALPSPLATQGGCNVAAPRRLFDD